MGDVKPLAFFRGTATGRQVMAITAHCDIPAGYFRVCCGAADGWDGCRKRSRAGGPGVSVIKSFETNWRPLCRSIWLIWV